MSIHIQEPMNTITSTFLFIDASVQYHQMLTASLQPGTQVHLLDANQDGITQITNILQNSEGKVQNSEYRIQSQLILNPSQEGNRSLQHPNSKLQNINIVSHATPGSIRLGNTHLSLDTLDRYTEVLKSWGNNEQVSINFYACNLATGGVGTEFITKLHHITGATIYASTTKVGNAALGGNWHLDAVYPIQNPKSKIQNPKSLPPFSSLLQNSDSSAFPLPSSFSLPFSPAALAAYPAVLSDTDGDGVDDSADLDDDNDGILDTA